MIYYTEQLHDNYLIPKIEAFYCDVCGEAVTDQDEMVKFIEVMTPDGKIKDVCPKCQLSPIPN